MYLEFEDGNELEFEFFLCQKLGWRSVSDMRKGLGNREYMQWSIYYQREAQRKDLANKKASG